MTPARLIKIQKTLGMSNTEMARRMWIARDTYNRWVKLDTFGPTQVPRITKLIRDLVRDQLLELTLINDELDRGE